MKRKMRKPIMIILALAMILALLPVTGMKQVRAEEGVWYASELTTGEDVIIPQDGTLILDADVTVGEIIFNECTLTIQDDGSGHTLNAYQIYSPASNSNLR